MRCQQEASTDDPQHVQNSHDEAAEHMEKISNNSKAVVAAPRTRKAARGASNRTADVMAEEAYKVMKSIRDQHARRGECQIFHRNLGNIDHMPGMLCIIRIKQFYIKLSRDIMISHLLTITNHTHL